MKYICALITVEDVARARMLYENILQQKVISDFGENVAFEGGFAIHKKDHFESLLNGKKVQSFSNSFELYFEHDNLLEIQNELMLKGFEFVHELCEQPWRQQVLRFYDYDKNIVEIGERLEHVAYRLFLEGKTVEEIMQYTYFTKEKTEEAIAAYTK